MQTVLASVGGASAGGLAALFIGHWTWPASLASALLAGVVGGAIGYASSPTRRLEAEPVALLSEDDFMKGVVAVLGEAGVVQLLAPLIEAQRPITEAQSQLVADLRKQTQEIEQDLNLQAEELRVFYVYRFPELAHRVEIDFLVTKKATSETEGEHFPFLDAALLANARNQGPAERRVYAHVQIQVLFDDRSQVVWEELERDEKSPKLTAKGQCSVVKLLGCLAYSVGAYLLCILGRRCDAPSGRLFALQRYNERRPGEDPLFEAYERDYGLKREGRSEENYKRSGKKGQDMEGTGKDIKEACNKCPPLFPTAS